ncbi:hypothetical protein CRYUN_Cryun28dG0074100 [Craigia yunnanensis]
MMQRALIFSSSNPITPELLSTPTTPPVNAVFPKRNCGWIVPSSSFQPPVLRLQNYQRTLPPLLCSASESVTNQPKMASQDEQDPRISKISSVIRVIPNFPKPGVMFQDITTLLLDTKAFRDTIDLFVERYRGKDISVVAGVEARGFIFGPPIALAIGAKFVPMRKPNKLPGEVISEEYSLEYGTDIMEMHVGAVQEGERALIVDDLVATGGTLCAAVRLLGPGTHRRYTTVCSYKLHLIQQVLWKSMFLGLFEFVI